MTGKDGLPPNIQAVIPYLFVDDAGAALDLYVQAFGAEERMRMTMPGANVVVHGEIALAGCVVMLGQADKAHGIQSPAMLGDSPSGVMAYVPDCDAILARAVAAGCTLTQPAEDMFWGDRMGTVKDPWGHRWMFATHQREVSEEQMRAAIEAMASGGDKA